MRLLAEGEAVIQIWSQTDPEGRSLNGVVQAVTESLSAHPELGSVVDFEGPTPHIPDYFSELYGTVFGWLIYVSNANPRALKKFVMALESSRTGRMADIDVFVSYSEKISRWDLSE